ncbi:MAG: PHB depolymerase family esterase [Hyphomicrobium sp.]|nr:PHB depolymerase family esterase [Hyphomicrobium sp.]
MTKPIPDEMVQAVRLTRSGRLSEATDFIQRLLRGRPSPSPSDETTGQTRSPLTIDVMAVDITASASHETSATPLEPAPSPAPPKPDPSSQHGSARIFEGLQSLPAGLKKAKHAAPSDLAPAAGAFITKSLSNAAGKRDYKLYIPSVASRSPHEPRPLIIMLHGCTQSADDFAAGTRMNFAAEGNGCFVAYPEQIAAANTSKCWNWFETKHQSRGRGEPSLIAGIAEQIMKDHNIDPRRVYIAGLSAGGAAASVVAEAYPDIFAAAGVHSGLACGVARDMPSAFAAMQGRHGLYTSTRESLIPTIVFHGDADKTVHPRNGADVVAGAAAGNTYPREVERGISPGGRSFTRSIQRNEGGQSVIEDWVIHGAGHAWSGGSPAGSFTDPSGPDATTEMLRFFLAHARSE